MKGDSRITFVPRWVRRLPIDIAATVVLVILTNVVVFNPFVGSKAIRIILGLPLLIFLPGYVLTLALYPERGYSEGSASSMRNEGAAAYSFARKGSIDWFERIVLSVGLSVATVPLAGLLLNYTPWGIRLVPTLVVVSTITLAAAGIATKRLWELEPDSRFPSENLLHRLQEEIIGSGARADTIVKLVLTVSVLVATASVAYTAAVPRPDDPYTEFYLLTEGEDRELVADGYPTEFHLGEEQPVVIGIGNREQRSMDYTVVVQLQRVRGEQIIEFRELGRFQISLEQNRTAQERYFVTPSMEGERLRLAFLLYVGEPPRSPDLSNAYRETHLWVNVSSGS